MSLSPLTFVGISKFSADLQTILSRSMQVASFPLQALQNDKSDLLQKKTLTMTLQSLSNELTSSLQGLANTGDSQGIQGTSSRQGIVVVNSATAQKPATYTLSEISSIATAASEISVTGFSAGDPVSTTGDLQLTFGSQTYDIHLTPEKNHLAGLRDAIQNLGIGLNATILTTGTGTSPNYLSVSSSTTGATTLMLKDDPAGANVDVLTSANQGTNAEFKLNGVFVSRTQNLMNDVIPGISFTIVGTTSGAETVNLSLSIDKNQLMGALNRFVVAYNNVVDFLDTQIGPSAGLLSGSNLIAGMSSHLRQLTSFQGSGELRSLASLGIELDKAGKLSLNQSTFNGITAAQLPAAFTLLGSSAQGLGSLVKRLNSFTDPVIGQVQAELNQYGLTENRLNSQISTLTDRIQQQQAALQSRLQIADTLLARLESQQSVLDAQLDSLQLTLYGRKDG